MHWEYKRIHTGPTLQCQGSRGKRTKSLAANLIPVSVSKNFARSVNVTRPHSVKDPTRSSCNTTPVLSCDRANRPKPGIGHAFGPWREWFLSLHTNQGHAPASCGNKHSPGRTCHVSGDCTFTLLQSCPGTSPLGVPETLCEAVRLARNLRHGIVLVVGDMVHQRLRL